MTALLYVGWCLWGMAAAGLAAKLVGRCIAQARAFEAVVGDREVVRTAHQMRLLLNRGDWRDPIERHHDAMTEVTQMFSLAVSAGLLWWLGSLVPGA